MKTRMLDGWSSRRLVASAGLAVAAMMLSRFPRVRLGHSPTPLEPMPRLSELLGGPNAVHQARRLHRPCERRQQDAQARIPDGRRAARRTPTR